jgi:hypothetical protein
VVRVQIEAGHRLRRSQGHAENKLCDPSVTMKGDSHRLKDRDLGRVPTDDSLTRGPGRGVHFGPVLTPPIGDRPFG